MTLQTAVNYNNMFNLKIVLPVICFFAGAAAGMGLLYECGIKGRISGEFSSELNVVSDNVVDWEDGIGEDVVIEFRSFVTEGASKKLNGASFTWCPVLGDKTVKLYENGALISVESKTLER